MENKTEALSPEETAKILGGEEIPGFKVKLEDMNPLAMMALATKYQIYNKIKNE
jgi:hypothetical protein